MTDLFNPNSKIKIAAMSQDVGGEMTRKNQGMPKAIGRDFFDPSMPNRLRQTGHFNFGVRV
jgi:hypothetical protein